MQELKQDKQHVLIIEDELDLLASVADYLELHGHIADTASDGRSGLNLATSNVYDVIVLDIGLPYRDGLSLCAEIRRSPQAEAGILLLTARDTLKDKVLGLDAGADDYLIKPFALEELESRIRALGRRARLNRGQLLSFDELSLNLSTSTALRNDVALKLSTPGLQLLTCLLQHAPRIVSRRELERALWGDAPPDSDALKVHMHALRSVVDKPFRYPLIKNIRGHGYRLEN
ncbi:MAG: response regulator transcription factor [Oceanococcus sp.]